MKQWNTKEYRPLSATALNVAHDAMTMSDKVLTRCAARTGRDAVHARDLEVDLHQLAQRQGTLLLRQDGAAGEGATAARQVSQHLGVRHPLWNPARLRARSVDPLSEKGSLAALRRTRKEAPPCKLTRLYAPVRPNSQGSQHQDHHAIAD